MKVFVLNAVIWTVFLNVGIYGATGYEEVPKKTCSRELTRRLSRVCNNGFNTMQRYISLSPRPRRMRRQVVDECCKEACTDATIKLYCMNPPPASSSSSSIALPSNDGPKETAAPVVHPRLRYQNIRIGTVPPEFNKIAVTAPLYRASFYRSYN